MQGESPEPGAALDVLRARLVDGLAVSRLAKGQLHVRAGLSRTTVYGALRRGAPAPSAATVVALARALRLPERELLALLRAATVTSTAGHAGPSAPSAPSTTSTAGRAGPSAPSAPSTTSTARHAAVSATSVTSAAGSAVASAGPPADGPGKPGRPGRPVGEWDPHDLEVHPAGPAPASGRGPQLPGYVPRDHDRVLAEAVREAAGGHSRMWVLAGTSSTGKTRACWEAVRPLAERGWWLWHPFDPTRAEAALADLERVRPRTVVWLNEAQHYLGDPRHGERIAAALHALLTRPERGPVLVLGTLWPEYVLRFTSLPEPGTPDRHSRVRELLARRVLTVPDAFDARALRYAEELAGGGDGFLAGALGRGARSDGRLAQDLAGAPELLRRYEQGVPEARALLEAAMDARRLGVGPHLPRAFLADAIGDYLGDADLARLTTGRTDAAFAELARPVHGDLAPLGPVPARRRQGPGGGPARAGGALRPADYLEEHGRATRLRRCPPASFWHAAAGYLSDADDLDRLASAAYQRHRLEWAAHLRERAAGAGSTSALIDLAWDRSYEGDEEGAESLLLRAAGLGDASALSTLAVMRETTHGPAAALPLYLQAAEAGCAQSLGTLGRQRFHEGDLEGARAFYIRAAGAGDTDALADLARLYDGVGDWRRAQDLYREAAEAGNTGALLSLALGLRRHGETQRADALFQRAVASGSPFDAAPLHVLDAREHDPGALDALYQVAAAVGSIWMQEMILDTQGRDGGDVEAVLREAVAAGSATAVLRIARRRHNAGAWNEAEALYQEALDAGELAALTWWGALRQECGDRSGAEALYRQAADAGVVNADTHRLWPDGLEPDGTPSPPWQ
ncbi:hypothetical protein ACIQUQ_24860 [Streptomyces sp. NPDC101118]|uniref:hypothetical protein n=1 Tax=Streptomyces sp. NPDC101118 TaxID=3366109 RepID=UPI0037F79298